MSSVRLTCAQKPYKGETWLLKRIRKGLVLVDEDDRAVTLIPTGQVGLRIHFPSFWASRSNVVITGDRGEEYHFEPKGKTIANVRALVDDCAEADPAATASAYRRSAIRDLLIGGGAFALGLIITCASFFFANPKGGFALMIGLLVSGLVEIGRGIYFAIKASQHRAVPDADDEAEEDDDEG
jgi:hypothetical protein